MDKHLTPFLASTQDPDYVKIAWTLRADPIGESESIFRTQTRVATTDAVTREKSAGPTHAPDHQQNKKTHGETGP